MERPCLRWYLNRPVPAQTELNNRKEWTAALYYNCFSTFRHIQRLHDVHSNMSQPICEIVYCHEHSLFNSEGTNGWLNSQRHSLGRKSDASGEVFLAWRNGPCYLRLLFNLKEGCFWWLVISVSHGQQTIRERIRKLNWNRILLACTFPDTKVWSLPCLFVLKK